MDKPLGRKVPSDWEHVEKYPLRAVLDEVTATKVPFAIGVNWYTDFDRPEAVHFGSITRYFVARNGIRGSVRGGHCVCIKPGSLTDLASWWNFYNQGREGACVGFGESRMMTLLNRKRYNARWLWDWAKSTDEWLDTNPGDNDGTSCRAGFEILRTAGHVAWQNSQNNFTYQQRDALLPGSVDGISAYRWTTSVDEVRAVLASALNDRLQAVPFLNSWGSSYPHYTWMPYDVLQRLMNEYGEVAIITDR